MVFELALVEDKGTYYFVKGVTKDELSNLANRNENMLKLSYSSYEKIKQGLEDNKNVIISKDMMTDEVLPGEVTVSEGEIDDLEEYKKIRVSKIQKKLSYSMSAISSLNVLSFTVINNELASEGFFITNKNREEKYIEIIETENEELIEKLEQYLNILDDIQIVLDIEKTCRNYTNKIITAVDVTSVDELLSEFYEEYDRLM